VVTTFWRTVAIHDSNWDANLDRRNCQQFTVNAAESRQVSLEWDNCVAAVGRLRHAAPLLSFILDSDF